jgi:cell fate (sporulation/competence/biofilm development) regulator YlbF (YheA/YmcA/DUF963 family)
MEDIIADAAALGKNIAAHPRMKAFATAARAVAEDAAAQEILKAYQDQIQTMREKEQSGKPIEADEKRALVDSEAKVAGNTLLKAMMKAQADYVEMMKRINDAIDQAQASAQPAADG